MEPYTPPLEYTLRATCWISGVTAIITTIGLLFTSGLFGFIALIIPGVIGFFFGRFSAKRYLQQLKESRTVPEKTRLFGLVWVKLVLPWLLLAVGITVLGMIGAFLTKWGIFVYVIGRGPFAAIAGAAWAYFFIFLRHK